MASFCCVCTHTHTHLFRERSTAAAGDVWFPSPANATSDGRGGRTDGQHSWTLRCVFFFSCGRLLYTSHWHFVYFKWIFLGMYSYFIIFFTKFWIISLLNWKLTFFIIPKLFFFSVVHPPVSRGWPVSHPVSFFFRNIFLLYLCSLKLKKRNDAVYYNTVIHRCCV